MASSGDLEKRQAWVARFARYRASGLSVARFCKEERLSANTFFYWAKRLRRPPALPVRAVPPRQAAARPTADGSTRRAVVRFRWKSGTEGVVPADCLETIRCLAEYLAEADGHRSKAFQEVVVKA